MGEVAVVDPDWVPFAGPDEAAGGAGDQPGPDEARGRGDRVGPDVRDLEAPLVLVPSGVAVPSVLDARVLIDTVHDGWVVPAALLPLSDAAWADLESAYGDERDWGAHFVAHALAAELGLSGYTRVLPVRPLLDVNRYAGVHDVPLGGDHRDAIFPPMARHLDLRQVRWLFEEVYDRVEAAFAERVVGRMAVGSSGAPETRTEPGVGAGATVAVDAAREAAVTRRTRVQGRLGERPDRRCVKLAIHTYRPRNETGTLRPEVSLITRSGAWDRQTDLRQTGLYDLLPRDLLASTTDRLLAYRIAVNLEQAGIGTSLDSPYSLPEGAMELRLQARCFFAFLRERFEAAKGAMALSPRSAESVHESSREGAPSSEGPSRVAGSRTPGSRALRQEEDVFWNLLATTNRRSSAANALRARLSGVSRAAEDDGVDAERFRVLYDDVRSFVRRDTASWVAEFRRGGLSALTLEVRRDHILQMETVNGRERPVAVHLGRVREIAACVAAAVRGFLCDGTEASPTCSRQPWL